jgi:hypothetical protein
LKDQLSQELGVRDTGQFVCEREVVWRGTRRTAEVVFANVHDRDELPDVQFTPTVPGQDRILLDYPFDDPHRSPADDLNRVAALRQVGVEADTVRLAATLPLRAEGRPARPAAEDPLPAGAGPAERLREHPVQRRQDARPAPVAAQRDTLTSQLTAALRQVYGIARADESAVGAQVGEEGHVHSVRPGHRPRLAGGAGFEHNLLALADGLFDAMYPKHPNFDPAGNRRAVTAGELRTVLGWVNRAAEQRGRVEVDRAQLPLVRRIAHPLELGEVSDGPFNLSTEWRRRIDQQVAAHPDERGERGDYRVEDIRRWIAALGYTGLDRPVSSLIIATYALLADRAWLLNGAPLATAPDLERIGAGHTLRAQPLPTAAEFSAARERAAEIFGVHVSDVLVARTVARLAGDIQAKLAELKPAVDGVRAALRAHARRLGMSPETPADGRVAAARDAADLTDRLARAADSTEFVRQLATAGAASVPARSLGAAISSAPRTLAALETAEWSREAIADAASRVCLPDVDDRALRGLKFSEALPYRLATATLAARLADVPHAAAVLGEPSRFVGG